MATSLTFIFPLPPDQLRVNARFGQHWGNLHRVKEGYRMACDLVLRRGAQPQQDLGYVAMVATVYLGRGQRCDPSDLGSWCKTPIDALVTGGWLSSDSSACIKSFTAVVERDAANPRLEIELKEVP